MSAEADVTETRRQVAVANRILAETGLATGVTASLGHASMRVPGAAERFVVKGRGYALDVLSHVRPEDMILCDLDGRMVDGPPGATQCFEVKMHSCVYKTHPAVQAVVHAHPRFVVVMSVLQATLVPMCQEGAALVRYPLPMYPHCKTVQTEEEGLEVAGILGDAPAVLLQGHGATTTGASLEEAVMSMMHLEEQARMNWYASCVAGPGQPGIPDELIAEMANRVPLTELSHFRDSMRAGRPKTGGVWSYYTQLATRSLDVQEGAASREV